MSFTGNGKTVNQLLALSSPGSGDYLPISNDGINLKKVSWTVLCAAVSKHIAASLSSVSSASNLSDSDKIIIATASALKSISYALLVSTLATSVKDDIQESIKEYVIGQLGEDVKVYVIEQLGAKIDGLPIIKTGRTSVEIVEANKPSSVEVAFPSGLFTSVPRVVATPVSSVPGSSILGVGVNNITKTGFTLCVTRTNTTTTAADWIAVGN